MIPPPTGHPADHEPHWLFLRQRRQPAEPSHAEIVDIFYCARCLGRVEVLDSVEDSGEHPGEIGLGGIGRRRGPMPTLGSAAGGCL